MEWNRKKLFRKFLYAIVMLLCLMPANSKATSNSNNITLEKENDNTLALFGGLGIAAKGKNGFTDKHSGTSIFWGTANYNHFFSDNFAIGLDYTYLGSHSGKDLLRCHFVAPTITGRLLMSHNRQGGYLSLAPGYMHYADKTKQESGHLAVFNKSYFGLKITLGYEVALSQKLAFQLRTDLLTAAWKENENYTIGDDNNYYVDKYGHMQEAPNTLFEPSLTFFSISVGLSYRF